MTDKDFWIMHKEILLEISEGKKSLDEALSMALQNLDRLEKREGVARVIETFTEEDLDGK